MQILWVNKCPKDWKRLNRAGGKLILMLMILCIEEMILVRGRMTKMKCRKQVQRENGLDVKPLSVCIPEVGRGSSSSR